MALETVAILLGEDWRLVSNAATGPFEAIVQGTQKALFYIGSTAPTNGLSFGLPRNSLSFASLAGKVWARRLPDVATTLVCMRTTDAGNPAEVLLPALGPSATTFTTAVAVGADIVTLTGRIAGDMIVSVDIPDQRVALSADASKIVRGPAAVAPNDEIRVGLETTHPSAPNSPRRSQLLFRVDLASLPALPLATGARVAGIGDSQIGYSNTFGGAVGGGASAYTGSLKAALSTGLGYIAWAKMLDSRFRFESWYDTGDPRGLNYVGANQGWHSDHLDWASFNGGILGRLPAVLARRPEVLVLEGGVNTIASGDDGREGTAAYVISKLDTMLKLTRYAGVWAILTTIYPRGDWIASNPAKQTIIDAVNVWIRAQAGRDGVLGILDAEPVLRPGGVFADDMFRDQIHLTPKGALTVGKDYLLPILQGAIASGVTYDRDPTVNNLLPSSLYNLPGTTGTSSGFGTNGQIFSGQVATGYTIGLGRNFSVVASKEVISGSLEQQVLVITPGGTTAQNYYEGSMAGFVADNEPFNAAQWYQMFCEVDLQNAESLTFIGLVGGHRSAANAVLTQTLALARESSTDYARGGVAGNRTLYLQSEPFKNDDATATKLAFALFWTGNKLSTNVLTARVRRPIIRRIADPRAAWGY